MRKKKSLADRIAEKIDAATPRVERVNQKLETLIARMDREGMDKMVMEWFMKRFCRRS